MKTRLLLGVLGFVINRLTQSSYKGVVMAISPVKLFSPLKGIAQRGLKNVGDYEIGMGLFALLVNQGIKQVVTKAIAIRLPKGKNPLGMAKKWLGLSTEEAEQTEKLGSLFGLFG